MNQVAIQKHIHSDYSETVDRLVIWANSMGIEKEAAIIQQTVGEDYKVSFNKGLEQIYITPFDENCDLELSQFATYFLQQEKESDLWRDVGGER